MSDETLRNELDAVRYSAFGNEAWFSKFIVEPQAKVLMLVTTAEAQRCLGAFLRGEKIPPTKYMRQPPKGS
ncbi:hypothetical protein [Nocardiopsis aegyptia]|uniref:Uncharacterized protein n=1 Tax=Nocardiopsis aegyptia TaxID=220378 RepID=A0A7Z0EIW4_9ACTN|nr:hypothetical protein [Nocardiopsis aegyptia]NYJ32802.1 hypothetical protein [Nocardiopsis aegyptia]